MSSTQQNVFNAPNIDMVPYDIELLNADGSVYTPQPGQVLLLVAAVPQAIVVPNSTDPSGATGNVVAQAGFSGAVSGTATFTDNTTTPPTVLNGTWSGTFTPNEPASLQVTFGTPAPGATAAAAVKSGASKS